MRKSRSFTEREIQVLKENPYTAAVFETRVSLTLDAKQKILERSHDGLTYRQIIEELGYDPAMLGADRIKNMVRNVLRTAASGQVLHEGYLRTANNRMDDATIEQLECNPASYDKLKTEVIYLRKEVEFLKKISQQVISGKRGES